MVKEMKLCDCCFTPLQIATCVRSSLILDHPSPGHLPTYDFDESANKTRGGPVSRCHFSGCYSDCRAAPAAFTSVPRARGSGAKVARLAAHTSTAVALVVILVVVIRTVALLPQPSLVSLSHVVAVPRSLDSLPIPSQLVRLPLKHRNIRRMDDPTTEKTVLQHHLVPT